MLLFIAAFFIGLGLFYVPTKYYGDNKLLFYVTKIMGFSVMCISVLLIYGVYKDIILFPLF